MDFKNFSQNGIFRSIPVVVDTSKIPFDWNFHEILFVAHSLPICILWTSNILDWSIDGSIWEIPSQYWYDMFQYYKKSKKSKVRVTKNLKIFMIMAMMMISRWNNDDDDDEDICILWWSVCLSQKMITSNFRAERQRREVSCPLGLAGRRLVLA